jgi:uncharacterized protein YkwD
MNRIAVASACAAFALAVILPGSAGARGGCPSRNASAASAPLKAMRAALVCLVNQQRTERGLPALRISSKLTTVAERWSRVMVARDDFSHARFVARLGAAHYDWQRAAENIATGYPSPAAVVAGWMASPGHCRNILDPAFRDVGTGEAPAPVPGWATGPATWTQDFGLLANQSAPSSNNGPAARCPYR